MKTWCIEREKAKEGNLTESVLRDRAGIVREHHPLTLTHSPAIHLRSTADRLGKPS